MKEQKKMNRVISWLKRNFICETIFSNGHIPVPFFSETYFAMYKRRCSRCHSALGSGRWKHMPIPNNSTPEQIKSWNAYDKEVMELFKKDAINEQRVFEGK